MLGIEVDMVFTVMAGEQMAFRVVLIHCGAVAQLDLGKGHRIQKRPRWDFASKCLSVVWEGSFIFVRLMTAKKQLHLHAEHFPSDCACPQVAHMRSLGLTCIGMVAAR